MSGASVGGGVMFRGAVIRCPGRRFTRLDVRESMWHLDWVDAGLITKRKAAL